MSDNPDHTRRWLINASGAAILSNVLTGGPSSAQVAGTSTTKSQDPDEASADAPISPVTTALCDYVASALDRDMPPEVVAKAKLHTLDTIAAMVSGSRLKAGEMAARYVDSLGGKPQATVIGTGILTSTVNAALANGMAAHGDETDLPRVDIPGSWIDYIVVADKPFFIEPLFTRDPRLIKQEHILMAMMAIKGIYAEHQVQSLNHGIGFNTAAIELLLPTYGEQLGLKGKICKHWTLNPHPTLIPAIESGWVESVHCFGGELGMEEYIRARPDIFFTGSDGSMRSNRAFCQLAGQYAVDMFIGATLQVDGLANSSTVTRGRLSGFGGAPNMGHDPHGRRHATPAWLNMITEPDPMQRGKKLVVQMVETFQAGAKPTFVETLDAVEVAKSTGMPLAPVMIYGDDVTHVLTEEGIAYLYRAESLEERRAMVAAVAGITDIGLGVDAARVAALRKSGKVVYPEDMGIRRSDATRSLLAASSVSDLVEWSGGLYNPPAKFRSW